MEYLDINDLLAEIEGKKEFLKKLAQEAGIVSSPSLPVCESGYALLVREVWKRFQGQMGRKKWHGIQHVTE